MDTFPTTVTPVIEFLAAEFQEGKQYATLNTYRSALSATLPQIEGHAVGQHPLVCQLMQGMFDKRPPVPRYRSTGEVDLVLQFQRKMASNVDLTLRDLSQKLTVLLALCNASRASDLTALDIRFMQIQTEATVFRIEKLTKTRRSGPPRTYTVMAFTEEVLCPVCALRQYLEATKEVRNSGTNRAEPLLISYRKPYTAISAATIGRWIKQVLQQAGVDTEVFTAHSTRSAACSAARARGVSIADVMATAGWPRKSTFEHFYHKPINATKFTEAVLGGNKGTCMSL